VSTFMTNSWTHPFRRHCYFVGKYRLVLHVNYF